MRIQYIKHNQIDKVKWDHCISRSVNGIVYAYSWYLDAVSEGWDALVGNDYEAVFPLTHNTKFGISYLYQPYFTQQLGFFSSGEISNQLVTRFLDAIPQKFKYISIQLNWMLKIKYNQGVLKPRVTHHLDLIEPYEIISSRYGSNTKRNISKSVAYEVSVTKGLNPQDLLNLKTHNLVVPLKDKHFQMLRRIISNSVAKGVGELWGAYDEFNQLCAGALFLKTNGKVVYLLASSSKEGKENRAMFALVDRYIFHHAEMPLILDFEGSSVESVARFYSGFGATPVTYYHFLLNRLPWYLRFFK